ncbi:TadE/TadG family type IV pilus assembly protein [Oceanibium sediminis]|uniref:TadE/TadG family type IV pilus assembly protein n=1 Tax=Oceanibium sediminis TaxID=2026339 RepID=UPI000DD49205|nr:Tad domain-containing protein [Oceanibium sediminis]
MTRPAPHACRAARRIQAARRDEEGGALVLGILWTAILLLIGGLAIDTTNAWRNRAMLQVTVDAATHAGVMKLPQPGRAITNAQKSEIIAEAVRMAKLHMSPSVYGEVVTPDTVQVGRWNPADGTIDTTSLYPDTIQVTAKRTSDLGNPVAWMIMDMIGAAQSWDVGATSMVQRFLPDCMTDGIVSAEYSELTSGNEIVAPFCLHGETGVSMSNSNSFEEGTIVSMPDFSMLELPQAGYESNPGLLEALAQEHLYPRLTADIPMLFEALQDIRSPYQPGYILNGYGHEIDVNQSDFNPAALSPGNVYRVRCGNGTLPLAESPSNKTLKLESDAVLFKNVIVTNCAVMISAGAFIGDSVVITSNTGSQSIGGNSGAEVGAPDSCTAGGRAALMTKGDVVFPSTAKFNDAQIVALGSVHIAAAPGGITGIQVEALGPVKLTASGGFALCPNRDYPDFQGNHYRFVK